MFGALSSLTGGGGLSVAPSSSAATGPTNIGQSFAPSFFSPFAVGPGASATATSNPAGANNLALYAALAAAALALFVLLRRK